MSESAAGALLEHLAYLEVRPGQRPVSFPLLRIEYLEGLSQHMVAPMDFRENLALTRSIGDEWLARREHLFLVVPSVLCPETRNWIMNPLHPEASEVRIVASFTPDLDLRRVRASRMMFASRATSSVAMKRPVGNHLRTVPGTPCSSCSTSNPMRLTIWNIRIGPGN
jgi:hypothetical protein